MTAAPRLCLYYLPQPETDRWFRGDRYLRPVVRHLIRGKPRPGGVDKVFTNLCRGLDKIGVAYCKNIPFEALKPVDLVGVLGRGRRSLDGYAQPNPIAAGPSLINHPSAWPTLFQDHPVACYLQASQWANEIYKKYFGERCLVWPVGIDSDEWRPSSQDKQIDFLVYDKILWDREHRVPELLDPILRSLEHRKLSSMVLRYGDYNPEEFKAALARTRAMVFLCEHESQGLAYQEALSSGVPILAWDQGWWLDPNRFRWREKDVPATSVPYFDQRCGLRFKSIAEFVAKLTEFLDLLRINAFRPRDYILENLTLQKCAQHYVNILRKAAAS